MFGFPKLPVLNRRVIFFEDVDDPRRIALVSRLAALRESHGVRWMVRREIGALSAGVSAIAELALDVLGRLERSCRGSQAESRPGVT